VCIPERAIDGLSPRQQESMLAHELAHVLRRDPAWLVASAVMEAVFFFQPLHHLVRRRIEELAEYQCDDWAARHSGTGVHLAKCLAEVAGWVEHQPSVPLVANMASSRSPIVRRITRLLDERRRQVAELAPAWRLGGAVCLLVAIAWLAPGVAATAAASPGVPGPPAAPTRVVVEDVLGDGRSDRARVHISGSDETVHVEVAAPRPMAPPLPPPPPAPPMREGGDHLHIIIEGGMGWDAWPFMPWHGHIGIDMRGSFFEDPFAADLEDVFELEANVLEQQAEAVERQAEAWERAVEEQERAMEQRAEAYERAARSAADATGATSRARSAAPAGEADAGLVAL
jgi:BlaR1 peptidase M56